MKKIYSIITGMLLLISSGIHAQSIPNGQFENWNSNSFDDLDFYQTSNYEVLARGLPFNAEKVADPQHLNYAIRLTTRANATDTMFGYFINGDPGTMAGGMPISGIPTALTGYFKCNIMPGDSAILLMFFKAMGAPVAPPMVVKFGGVQTSYVPFSIPITGLMFPPDTVMLGAASSDAINNIQVAGSMIQFDNLSFTGLANQPAQMNGSFENWTVNTIYTPMQWFSFGDWDGSSILRTTDKYQGNYAVELQTYAGDNNGNPVARNSMISTGNWVCQGSNCNLVGGFPFANLNDTLVFHYKYAPQNNDTAFAEVLFKKNGSIFSIIHYDLLPASNYQQGVLPFNLFQAPDTAVVMFVSSGWNDTLMASVGSVLKVDDVYFKSQAPTFVVKWNMKNVFHVFPNPSSGKINLINTGSAMESYEVYNSVGAKVKEGSINANSATVEINEPGIYLLQVKIDGVYTTKRLIIN